MKSTIHRSLLLGIPAIMLGLPLQNWLTFAILVPKGYGDFRAFYAAGWILRTGNGSLLYSYATQKAMQDSHIGAQSIALPFNHLAYESLLFAPFTLLHYAWAWLAWLVINLAILLIAHRLLRPYLKNLAATYSWAPAALFFTFVPIAAALMQGQDSILLLALLIGVFVAREKANDFTAGLLLGCGLFKFQIVLPIAALFLLWKEWKLVRGFLLSSSLALAVSLALIRLSGLRLYFGSLLATARQSNQFAEGVYPDAMPNLRGLTFGLGLPMWLLIVVSLLILFLASRLRPSLDIAIVVAALLSYHFLIHDMSILLIPGLRALDKDEWQGWLLLLSPLLIVHPHIFYLASLLLGAYLLAHQFRKLVRSDGKSRIDQTGESLTEIHNTVPVPV